MPLKHKEPFCQKYNKKKKLPLFIWKSQRETKKGAIIILQHNLNEKSKERNKYFTRFIIFLVLWIYNLVKFLRINGKVKQLKTEIEEAKR
ncbi:MAG: hypothetical protein MRECE_34c010 [Mycoplasmataceae bacterium CE_OT135]|nr:MAG: hypothetical protein MRECE_34c010 [Mycoplasmataceae bacterium CE_OT135]